MGHWKKLTNPDYIGAYELIDRNITELVVKIVGISRKMVVGDEGKKSECTVAELEGFKPMILNATNCKMISKIYKTPLTENWLGKYIKLYVNVTRIAGVPTDCLRIRDEIPVIKLPDFTPTHPKWESAKEAIKTGKATIADITKSYSLTPENEQLLLAHGD